MQLHMRLGEGRRRITTGTERVGIGRRPTVRQKMRNNPLPNPCKTHLGGASLRQSKPAKPFLDTF